MKHGKRAHGAVWRTAAAAPLCAALLLTGAQAAPAAQAGGAGSTVPAAQTEMLAASGPQEAFLIGAAAAALAVLAALTAALVRDRRQRRALQTALGQREDQFKAVMDLTPGGICTFRVEPDGAARLRYANSGLYHLLGYPAPTMMPEQIQMDERIHPEDREVFQRQMDRCRQGCGEVRLTFRALRQDGTYGWVALQAIRRPAADGRPLYYAMLTDVDPLKRLQENTEANERTLQAAMSHTHVDYWVYDPVRHTARQGRHTQELFGVPELMEDYPASWLARGITLEEDVPELLKAYAQIDAGADHASCEVRERHPDGSVQWLEIRMSSLYGADGRRTGVLCTGMDCTQRHQDMERYTRQSQQIRKFTRDAVASAHLDLTRNTCVPGPSLYPGLLAELDGTADALFERMKSRAVTPEQAERFGEKMNRAALTAAYERGVSQMSLDRCCWINGAKRWLTLWIEMTRNPATGDLEASIYSFDIDDRKALEQIMDTLLHREYRMLLRIDLTADTARVFSARNGKEPAREITGAEQFLLDGVREGCDEDELDETLDRLRLDRVRDRLEHGDEYVTYADRRSPGGGVRRLRYAFVWLDRAGGMVCCAVTDITDAADRERRRSEALRSALEEARRAAQAKGEFLSRMSHEIRTPMNAILGLTQIIREDPRGPEVEELLGKLLTSGEYLLGLINDVLDMSRIEAGRVELHLEDTDLRKLHAAVYDMMEPRMREKGIRFRMDTDRAVVPYAVVDRLRVQQIYINLLGNAVKFSQPGTEITCTVSHELLDGDRFTAVMVFRDQGCGMSPEFVKRAFEPFEQEDNGQQDPQCGTGLGLAIVKNLTEQMDGTVELKSELGRGSEFTLRFTVRVGHAPAAQPEMGADGASLSGRRVLLAEDHPVNTEIAKRMLQRQGIEVDHAADGRAAVDRYLSAEPGYYDAVLMDIRMPVMNGLEAARAIRASGRADASSIPIIAMTANAFASDRQESREAGMNAHLSKPIRQAELLETLRRFLR